jgi:peptide/nickel transport system substrate-binding protein
MPPDVLKTVVGYDPDIKKIGQKPARSSKNSVMGPDRRLAIRVSTRNIPVYRDPAVILIDQLKDIYIDGELDTVETANWFPKIARKIIRSGSTSPAAASMIPTSSSMKTTRAAPSATIPATVILSCRNSSVNSRARRLKINADRSCGRSISSCRRRGEPDHLPLHGGTCWHPHVKGITLMINSIFNG